MAEPRTVRENANTLSSVQIAEILPHRYPFALVDRVLDYEPGQWAIGRKCVTRNEEFFNGHFPAQPVMPGVLLLEALAQTGAVAALSLPETRASLRCSAASRVPASVSRSPGRRAHPALRAGAAARRCGRRQGLGMGGWQMRRHRRADLCADRSSRIKMNEKRDRRSLSGKPISFLCLFRSVYSAAAVPASASAVGADSAVAVSVGAVVACSFSIHSRTRSGRLVM